MKRGYGNKLRADYGLHIVFQSVATFSPVKERTLTLPESLLFKEVCRPISGI
jgi:hypothetical protein